MNNVFIKFDGGFVLTKDYVSLEKERQFMININLSCSKV
jgi:hypothetical protein